MNDETTKWMAEQETPVLRVFRGHETPAAEDLRERLRLHAPADQAAQQQAEVFWSGRNLAMRRSARVAA